MRKGVFLLSVGLLFIAVGCQSPRAERAPARVNTSVKPGINEEYLKPDLDARQMAARFERESREVFARRQDILEAVNLQPGMAVADIGAGSGLFTVLFAKAVGPRGRVYAVDIATNLLALIEQRAQADRQGNVRTVLADEESVKLPANSVDLAFVCDTYHHFEYPQATLASIHRSLRRNGQLVIVDFRRVPGQSSDWVLEHVRAGQDVFTREIEAAGFRLIGVKDFMKENYFLRFQKTGRKGAAE